MKFNEALEALRNGERLVNASLSAKGGYIVRQIPQIVPQEVSHKLSGKNRNQILYNKSYKGRRV